MPTVTVQSAHGQTVSLSYDSSANALLAQYVANAIQTGIGNSTMLPFAGNTGPMPPLGGKTGEWVQNGPGVVVLGHGWDYVVDPVASANITAPSDPNVQVLVGSGNLIFNGADGAGSVIAGGGNNQVILPALDTGSWFIGMGNGNDTVKALGSGNDTISLGSGSDTILLGAGNSAVTTSGSATITGSSTTGSETVTAFGSNVVYGMNSKLVFVGVGGATVFGGTGSDTVTGGSGPDVFYGGSGGNNVLTAGLGAATLFGGGNGDQLFASGSGAQILYAAGGNESLTGSSVSGASDAYVGSAGATSVSASPNAGNLFEFIHGQAGGTLVESGLTSIGQIQMHLTGFASNDTSSVVAQNNSGGNLNVTLSDGTQITFKNIASPLTNSNFS